MLVHMYLTRTVVYGPPTRITQVTSDQRVRVRVLAAMTHEYDMYVCTLYTLFCTVLYITSIALPSWVGISQQILIFPNFEFWRLEICLIHPTLLLPPTVNERLSIYLSKYLPLSVMQISECPVQCTLACWHI